MIRGENPMQRHDGGRSRGAIPDRFGNFADHIEFPGAGGIRKAGRGGPGLGESRRDHAAKKQKIDQARESGCAAAVKRQDKQQCHQERGADDGKHRQVDTCRSGQIS